MDSAKNGRWSIPFKKFGRLRFDKKCNFHRSFPLKQILNIYLSFEMSNSCTQLLFLSLLLSSQCFKSHEYNNVKKSLCLLSYYPQLLIQVCFFLYALFIQQYFSHVGRWFLSHLSWKEPVLDSFPPCQTTKAYPEDRTHAREVTGLEVSDFKHLTTEADYLISRMAKFLILYFINV